MIGLMPFKFMRMSDSNRPFNDSILAHYAQKVYFTITDSREYFVEPAMTGGVRLSVSDPESAHVNDSRASICGDFWQYCDYNWTELQKVLPYQCHC